MSLPISERENPRDIATDATVSGRFHDVVVSLSKAIHEVELDSRDLEELQWAKSLLDSAGATSAIVTMPSAKELSSRANPVLILKRVAQPPGEDPDKRFRELSQVLESVIRGQRDPNLSESLESVRSIFSMVSQMTLGANVAKKTEQAPVRIWPDLTTSSTS